MVNGWTDQILLQEQETLPNLCLASRSTQRAAFKQTLRLPNLLKGLRSQALEGDIWKIASHLKNKWTHPHPLKNPLRCRFPSVVLCVSVFPTPFSDRRRDSPWCSQMPAAASARWPGRSPRHCPGAGTSGDAAPWCPGKARRWSSYPGRRGSPDDGEGRWRH